MLCIELAPGCGPDVRRGGAGESCTSANDCSAGLACIAQVCVALGDAGPAGSGNVGASCAARRDCAAGLSCVQNACQPAMVGTSPDARYSELGESCQAKNDCAEGLACMGGVCRADSLSLSQLPKSCYRVECATKDDCCASFTPNPNCDMYMANCAMDPVFCATYRSLCECNQDCVDEQCVAGTPGCKSDGECTSMQTPFCVDGKCRQCNQDSACSGDASKCMAGVCMAPCMIDENCPMLHKCQDGACVESGCGSDRECAFLTKDEHALCRDGKCQSPCSVDSDCMADKNSPGFQICSQGMCVFVGCDDDAQCRALFGLNDSPGKTHAVCR